MDGERSSIKTTHPFLTDPAVRQALNLLVDRASVQAQIYGRTGIATVRAPIQQQRADEEVRRLYQRMGVASPSMGRAVVHKLPKGGWLWNPDEGVQPEIFSFDTNRSVVEAVWLGMLGYLILT
mgnify:CR=1 FL=1